VTWYRNRFVRLKTGKMQPYSSHLRKGASVNRYPKSAFSKATDWEKTLIEDIENRYERLRLRSAALRKLRSALVTYERLLAADFSEYPEFSEAAASKEARGEKQRGQQRRQ